MFVYNIGYDTCEESEHTQLYHELPYSHEELEAIILKAVPNAIKAYQADERNKLEFFGSEDLHKYLIDVLIAEYGFKPLKFQAWYETFGWAKFFVDGWDEYTTETDDKLKAAARAAIPDWEKQLQTEKAEVEKQLAEITHNTK